MARTILLVALVCAFAGLSVNAQCAPDGSVALGQCERCGVVPKDQGAECETDTNACTDQQCDGSSSADSACMVVGGTECNDPPICTSGGTCNAASGECEYDFNSGDTRCTEASAPTCKRNECQQDSMSDSATCEEVNVDDNTPCTPTTPEPCTDYKCVGGSCVGESRCLSCQTCVEDGADGFCDDDCEDRVCQRGTCVAGDPAGEPDECTYMFDENNNEGCPATGDTPDECKKFACVATGGGSCGQVADNTATCDDGNQCTTDTCVDGACMSDNVGPNTPCTRDGVEDAECFCVDDGSGPSTCSLCLSECPDTKNRCTSSNRFCAERDSAPGKATCGSVTCSILCNRACGTDTTYASSDCNNGGGCSCSGAISKLDDTFSFTGPCCRCTATCPR